MNAGAALAVSCLDDEPRPVLPCRPNPSNRPQLDIHENARGTDFFEHHEVISDIHENVRGAPNSEHRHAIGNILENVRDEEAERLRHCAPWSRCRSTFCGTCQRHRGARYARQLEATGHTRWWFVVLSIKSPATITRDDLDRLKRAVTAFRRRTRIRTGLQRLELDWSQAGWHPHWHMIVAERLPFDAPSIWIECARKAGFESGRRHGVYRKPVRSLRGSVTYVMKPLGTKIHSLSGLQDEDAEPCVRPLSWTEDDRAHLTAAIKLLGQQPDGRRAFRGVETFGCRRTSEPELVEAWDDSAALEAAKTNDAALAACVELHCWGSESVDTDVQLALFRRHRSLVQGSPDAESLKHLRAWVLGDIDTMRHMSRMQTAWIPWSGKPRPPDFDADHYRYLCTLEGIATDLSNLREHVLDIYGSIVAHRMPAHVGRAFAEVVAAAPPPPPPPPSRSWYAPKPSTAPPPPPASDIAQAYVRKWLRSEIDRLLAALYWREADSPATAAPKQTSAAPASTDQSPDTTPA